MNMMLLLLNLWSAPKVICSEISLFARQQAKKAVKMNFPDLNSVAFFSLNESFFSLVENAFFLSLKKINSSYFTRKNSYLTPFKLR